MQDMAVRRIFSAGGQLGKFFATLVFTSPEDTFSYQQTELISNELHAPKLFEYILELD